MDSTLTQSALRRRRYHEWTLLPQDRRRLQEYSLAVAYARADIRIDRHYERARKEFLKRCAHPLTEHEKKAADHVYYRLKYGVWPEPFPGKYRGMSRNENGQFVAKSFAQYLREKKHIAFVPLHLSHPKFSQTCVCGAVFSSTNCNAVRDAFHKHLLDIGCEWPYPIPEVDDARRARKEIKELLALIFGGVRL